MKRFACMLLLSVMACSVCGQGATTKRLVEAVGRGAKAFSTVGKSVPKPVSRVSVKQMTGPGQAKLAALTATPRMGSMDRPLTAAQILPSASVSTPRKGVSAPFIIRGEDTLSITPRGDTVAVTDEVTKNMIRAFIQAEHPQGDR